MMNKLIFDIFVLLSLYMWSVIFHELGHYIALRMCGEKPIIYIKSKEIVVGDIQNYLTLSKKQRAVIYIWGIGLGLMPFFYMYYLSSVFNITMAMILLIIYLWGCRSDIKNLWKLSAGE